MTLRDEDRAATRPAAGHSSLAQLSVPESRRPPAPPGTRWWQVAVVATVVVGVALRLISYGPLWLDEAQSVSIASGPLRQIPAALHHDGAPPLWYVLLHLWMQVFGDSPWSVRILSALPAIAALPVVYLLGRRLAGREVGQYSLLLLAASPFAIRYAVETRMYSLVLLLSVVGAHALLSVHRRPGWRPVAALAVVTAALLYTHYYALWLAAAVGAGELWRVVRRRDAAARRALAGLALGGVAFLPWLPVLAFQSAHTGAPWASPPTVNALLDTINVWAGGNDPGARVLALVMLALPLLAVLGRPAARGVVVGLTPARLPLRLVGVVVGTLALAIATDMASRNAYDARYSSVVSGLFVVVVAMGVVVLPSARGRRVTVAVLALLGLVAGATKITTVRTQAGQVAAAINRLAHPGDVVAYCPDQLGPSVSRLLHTPARQVVFPNFAAPGRVDWVDYTARMKGGRPAAFLAGLDRLAGSNTIWVVYGEGYRPVQDSCPQLVTDLVAARGVPQRTVTRRASVWENIALLGFPPR